MDWEKFVEKVLHILCISGGVLGLIAVVCEWGNIDWIFRILLVISSVTCLMEG